MPSSCSTSYPEKIGAGVGAPVGFAVADLAGELYLVTAGPEGVAEGVVALRLDGELVRRFAPLLVLAPVASRGEQGD